MASTPPLEQLRQYAIEEQFLAAAEGRTPDRDMLDELGKTVLHDFTPVVCRVEEAHYLDFNPDVGYEYMTHDNNQPVVGAFGGFHVQPVVEDFGMDGKINRYEVGFFVLDTKYNDTGFVCPVIGSELFDVAGALEGDPLYEELCVALAEEEIDMLKVQDIYQRIHDPEKRPYFLAYLRSVVAPIDVYSAVSTSAYIMHDSPQTEEPRAVMYREPLWMNISKYHRFTSGSIMKGAQELALLMGKQRRLYIPLRFIEGSEPPRSY